MERRVHGQAIWVLWACVAILAVVALVMRAALVAEGAMDVDAINLGLAALDFDVLEYRPHPPGYAGYVLLLKLVHALAPGLSPLEVARLGSLLCGAASVPAACWAALQLTRGGEDPTARMVRPLAAAAFAAVNPVLWYYGADGQSHAAEGLATLLLLGLAARAHTRGTRRQVVLALAALALAGAIRPNIAALASPLALWLLWRRPLGDWLLGLGAAAAVTAAWVFPTVAAGGGWHSYTRASEALYGAFFDNYSLFGARSLVAVNLNKALWGLAWAAPPLLALAVGGRISKEPRNPGKFRGGKAPPVWRRPWLAVLLANLAFYGLVYTAEPGYFAGVAALLCLIPAAWPAAPSSLLRGRAALAVLASVAMVLLGPARLPRMGISGAEPAATLSRVLEEDAAQQAYREVVCGAAKKQPALLVTDNMVLTHTRLLPLVCPGMQVGVLLLRPPLNPKLDNWLIFRGHDVDTLPTAIPLQIGPPKTGALRRPVTRVITAPDASPGLRAALRAAASCAPTLPPGGHGTEVYPAACLPELRLGENVLRIPIAGEHARSIK